MAAKNNTSTKTQPVIAFYAPLKSPLHPTPSGDRKIAQLFIKALQHANFDVELASQLRSFDKKGNAQRQLKIIALARKEANRILTRWRKNNIRPFAWFSYHLYYKAPDLIGPFICQTLNIPYIVAEASWAIKRANGPWSIYHAYVDQALKQADKVICINPIDKIALTQYFQPKAPSKNTASPISSLKPFLDNAETIPAHQDLQISRQNIAKTLGLNPKLPWFISVAMMRNGDKYTSYTILQKVINKLHSPFQLLIIGDGEKSDDVHELFIRNHDVFFAGLLPNEAVLKLLPHFQLLIWPAINEALGMIFLEAQQAKVPVIAGDQGGVKSVIKDKHSGLVLPMTSYDDLANTMSQVINELLMQPQKLTHLQKNTAQYIQQSHSLDAAATQLKVFIQEADQHFRAKAC